MWHPSPLRTARRSGTKYRGFSGHAWLEDEDGFVYDFWNDADFDTGKDARVEGVSKKTIKTYGFEYEEYPKDIQTKMFVTMLPSLKMYESAMKMGVTVMSMPDFDVVRTAMCCGKRRRK